MTTHADLEGLNSVVTSAAEAGQLSVLQWLDARGCAWKKKSVCCVAADGGHLELLQWARAQGCPWDWHACKFAAEAGHLPVLQYLRSNGCPWSKAACLKAVSESEDIPCEAARAAMREWISAQSDDEQ